jgi:DNA modification methylase
MPAVARSGGCNSHPHAKAISLIARLIAAVTEPEDLVVGPAAGRFVVMHAAHRLGRNFIGVDIAYEPDRDHGPTTVDRISWER